MTCFVSTSLRRARAAVPRVAIPLFLVALTSGCGPGETISTDSTTSDSTSPVACTGPDITLPDGRCQPPGLPLDMPCPPGETPLADGSCQAAGVPPSECGEGFVSDGEMGCAPVLPEQPCPEGWIAVPGETECHEVGECGQGKWGDIPIDAKTEFVDGSYAGQDSDGTEQKPWTTIQAGLNAVAYGGIVAVAAGTYAEDVEVAFTPAAVWGVCPAKVTIQGVSPDDVAFGVFVSWGELHGVHLTGPGAGAFAMKNADLLLDQVWLEGTQVVGILCDERSSVTVRGSLIEHVKEFGAAVYGAKMLIERSVLRDVPTGPMGFGVLVDALSLNGHRAKVTVRSSLLERVHLAAVNVLETDVTFDGVAVRSMGPVSAWNFAPRGGLLAGCSTIDVRRSTFEGMPIGILWSGSTGVVEHATFTDGEPISPQYKNIKAGIYVQEDPVTFEPADLDLRSSKLARLPEYGLGIDEGTATVASTLFQDNTPEEVESATIRGAQANLTLSRSVLKGSRHSALTMEGSAVVVEETRISGTLPTTHAGYGIAIRGYIQEKKADASLVLRSSLVEDCYESAVAAIEADVTIETSILRNVKPRTTDGLFGDGFVLMAADPMRGSATLTGSLIEGAARAGIAAFGSRIAMGNTASMCATFPLAGESYEGVPFSFEKTGDNACGCSAAAELCQVDSPGLAPPPVK